MTNSWPYKVFYYTVLSVVLISILANTSTIISTAFYQGFGLEETNTSIFGISINESKDKNKVITKKYVDASIPLILSVAVAVSFVYFLKPKHLEKQA